VISLNSNISSVDEKMKAIDMIDELNVNYKVGMIVIVVRYNSQLS